MEKIKFSGVPSRYAAPDCEFCPYSLTDVILDSSPNTETILDDLTNYQWD
ncbi:MAG: hypothetical protein J6O51_08800 [Bacteroidales bacterium]|nr:hypothetical protein [Bacteroidales bacterium]